MSTPTEHDSREAVAGNVPTIVFINLDEPQTLTGRHFHDQAALGT